MWRKYFSVIYPTHLRYPTHLIQSDCWNQKIFTLAHERNKEVRRLSARFATEQKSLRMFELNKRSLLFDAPYDFDCFLRYIEWNRPNDKRFYLPRRKVLLPIVNAFQQVADGELDLLTVSMPRELERPRRVNVRSVPAQVNTLEDLQSVPVPGTIW